MTHPTDPRDAAIDAILANRGLPFTTYTDPSSASLQRRLGISQRAIVNACKRNGWPWRKVYGRIWVCADFEQRWAEITGKDSI